MDNNMMIATTLCSQTSTFLCWDVRHSCYSGPYCYTHTTHLLCKSLPSTARLGNINKHLLQCLSAHFTGTKNPTTDSTTGPIYHPERPRKMHVFFFLNNPAPPDFYPFPLRTPLPI